MLRGTARSVVSSVFAIAQRRESPRAHHSHRRDHMMLDLAFINELRTNHGMPPFASLTEASEHSRRLERERAQRKATQPPTPSAAPSAPAALSTEGERLVREALERDRVATAEREAGAAALERERAAAAAASERDRVALEAAKAAVANGDKAEDPNALAAERATRRMTFEFRMTGERLTPYEAVALDAGLLYDDARAMARQNRLDIAIALEAGVELPLHLAVARNDAKRAAHAGDRKKILALVAAYPNEESLLTRLAADTEVTFEVALDSVRAAESRAFAVMSAHTDEVARSAADHAVMTSAKQDAARARAYIDEQAATGVIVSAAEAVAHITALAAE